jgi:hypothetical protein
MCLFCRANRVKNFPCGSLNRVYTRNFIHLKTLSCPMEIIVGGLIVEELTEVTISTIIPVPGK